MNNKHTSHTNGRFGKKGTISPNNKEHESSPLDSVTIPYSHGHAMPALLVYLADEEPHRATWHQEADSIGLLLR